MRRRTARGEIVDFDLIKAKQQMTTKPPPKEVSVRQEIIDRRLRKKATAMNPSPLNTTPVKPVAPEPKEVVEPETPEVVEVETSENVESDTPPRRRQKTKPKQSSGDDDATD